MKCVILQQFQNHDLNFSKNECVNFENILGPFYFLIHELPLSIITYGTVFVDSILNS